MSLVSKSDFFTCPLFSRSIVRFFSFTIRCQT